LLRNLIFDVAWRADVIVIDAPPGTGEEIQVMVRELPLSGALFVTTPQDLAQMDAERTLSHLRQHAVPVIGMVQNMASLTCPHCDQAIDLYGQSKRLEDAGVQVLGRIPFDTRLSVTADTGLPLVLGDPRGSVAFEFARIGGAVRRWLAERDQELEDRAA
jgi:ATP-binding protein involved in chromosome partitioning